MSVDFDQLRDLFFAALEQPPDQRDAYLEQACAGDEELHRNLALMLQAQAAGEGPLDRGPLREEGPPASLPGSESPGMVIAGRYKLLELIGEGGMGTVWMAQQQEPVKRLVALKLLKAGLGSRASLVRFEAERQALALMDHPHIAKVLDGGVTGTPGEPGALATGVSEPGALATGVSASATEAGRPFFVMELVKGVPITTYCDEYRLTIRQRLELFVPVCQAVQHAHQKGIIHRDLKPSNVLVALYDDQPVVKVIDFGVAKALGQQLTEETLHTGFGAVVGTVEYMSPEQASFNQLDIDTRSDLYALGVLLYELLTGTTPLEHQRVKEAGILEALRIIREEEAPTLSQRLNTTEQLPAIAARRGLEPAKLTRLVRGELDWIVMKALERDRNRRYETASALALDIQRYLADEPVQACPPSLGYRLGKFLKRHKGPVLAASLLVLALLGGVIGTTIGLIRAEHAWQAEAKRAEGERQAKDTAQRRLTQLEKANDLLGSIFHDLDPRAEETEGKPLRAILGERLDQLQQELDAEAVGDPLTVAQLQMTLGYSQLGLGYADKAIELFTRARATFTALLGPDHPDTLTSMNGLAASCLTAGQLDQALPLFEEVLRLRQALLGPDHPDTLTTMNNLALGFQTAGQLDRALMLFEEVLQRSKAQLGSDQPETLTRMNNLAAAYQAAGHPGKALPLFEEVLRLRQAQLGLIHPHTLSSMNNLAAAYQAAGRLGKALPLFEEALRLRQAHLGPDHPETLRTMNNLAASYLDAGQLERALPLLEEAFRLSNAKFGPDHPDTLRSMINRASGFQDAGQLERALPLYEEAFQLSKAKFGPDHPLTLTSMNNLATGYQAAGRLERALSLLEEAFQLSKAKFGPDHPLTLTSMNNLARGYQDTRQLGKALPLYEEVFRLRRATLGPDHPATLTSMNDLAASYYALGQLGKALPLWEEAFQLSKANRGSEHPDTLSIMNNLATLYWRMKKLDQSIPLFEQTLSARQKKLGENHPDTLRTLANLGLNYRDAKRLAEAIPLLEKAHGQSHRHASLRWVGNALLEAYLLAEKKSEAVQLIHEVLQSARQQWPPDSPQLADALVAPSVSLFRLKEYAEAEKLLQECLAIRVKAMPDSWFTFHTQSLLGTALLEQQKYAEAEPLLVQGYEGMKQREAAIPAGGKIRLTEALERLVQLYEAWDKEKQAGEWRKQLEAQRAAGTGAEKE